MVAVVFLWGVRYYQNIFTPFLGCSMVVVICLLRTVLHSIGIFSTQFYAIGSTALQIILNYPSGFPGLREIQILFQNYILRSPL